MLGTTMKGRILLPKTQDLRLHFLLNCGVWRLVSPYRAL